MWHLVKTKSDFEMRHPLKGYREYPTQYPCLVEFGELGGPGGDQWVGRWKPIPEDLNLVLLEQLLTAKPITLRLY